jgi:sulfur relay protein TusB/DsrH
MSYSAADGATLHLVFASPGAGDATTHACAHARAGDAIVLLQNGVLVATHRALDDDALARALAAGVVVHAMSVDLDARAFPRESVRAGVRVIDDTALVALAVTYRRSVSWW